MNAKALGLYYTFIIHRTIYVSVLYVIVFCFSFFCVCVLEKLAPMMVAGVWLEIFLVVK